MPVFASGIWVMAIASYSPWVRYQPIIFPPAASTAFLAASIRAGVPLMFLTPCSVKFCRSCRRLQNQPQSRQDAPEAPGDCYAFGRFQKGPVLPISWSVATISLAYSRLRET